MNTSSRLNVIRLGARYHARLDPALALPEESMRRDFVAMIIRKLAGLDDLKAHVFV